MSRIQLALNVSNLDAAVDFYSKLFGVKPTKYFPGYANFAISQPPLKLVLMENPETAGTLNHLGVEVETEGEVDVASQRLEQLGVKIKQENQVNCCYALQDKVWLKDGDGLPWEIYTVLGDSPIRDRTEVETSNCDCKS
jgi:catechol 2,3-dioxygenase-like lactoylglutathione lyase family enzyme